MVWELDTSVGGEGDAPKEEKLVTSGENCQSFHVAKKRNQSSSPQFAATECGAGTRSWRCLRSFIVDVELVYCAPTLCSKLKPGSKLG